MDEMRASRIRSALEQAGLDVICRLAENVLFLTGYWPRDGFSFIIFPYHEPTPFLHPKGRGVVRAGMITSVEPGVYIEGWDGLRIEDNVLARPDGGENLSVFDTALH